MVVHEKSCGGVERICEQVGAKITNLRTVCLDPIGIIYRSKKTSGIILQLLDGSSFAARLEAVQAVVGLLR